MIIIHFTPPGYVISVLSLHLPSENDAVIQKRMTHPVGRTDEVSYMYVCVQLLANERVSSECASLGRGTEGIASFLFHAEFPRVARGVPLLRNHLVDTLCIPDPTLMNSSPFNGNDCNGVSGFHCIWVP